AAHFPLRPQVPHVGMPGQIDDHLVGSTIGLLWERSEQSPVLPVGRSCNGHFQALPRHDSRNSQCEPDDARLRPDFRPDTGFAGDSFREQILRQHHVNSFRRSSASLRVSYFFGKQKRIQRAPSLGSSKKLDPGTAATPTLSIKCFANVTSSSLLSDEKSAMT